MWAAQAPRERKYGICRCSCVNATGLSLVGVLGVFGLNQRDDLLKEVSSEVARASLICLLGTSFVGGLECMPRELAGELADAFLKDLEQDRSKFYSNGDWVNSPWSSWNPFTDSVFDGGILIYGPQIAGCVWVEEDD